MGRVIAVLCLAILCAHASIAYAFTFEIHEEDLQGKVAAMMPVELTRWFVTTTLSNPQITLADSNNEIAVRSDIRVVAPGGVAYSGNARILGQLIYKPVVGGFFMQDVSVTDIRIDGLTGTYLKSAQHLAQLIATRIFTTYPVYVLRNDSMKERMAKSMLKSVSVERKKLVLQFDLVARGQREEP